MATKKRPPKAKGASGDRHLFAADATPQTTTNAYVDVGVDATAQVWFTSGFRTKHIRIKNTGGVNGTFYKVVGSIDGITYDKDVVAEAVLALSAVIFLPITDIYDRIKVQVKANVGSAFTTVSAQAVATAT